MGGGDRVALREELAQLVLLCVPGDVHEWKEERRGRKEERREKGGHEGAGIMKYRVRNETLRSSLPVPLLVHRLVC